MQNESFSSVNAFDLLLDVMRVKDVSSLLHPISTSVQFDDKIGVYPLIGLLKSESEAGNQGATVFLSRLIFAH